MNKLTILIIIVTTLTVSCVIGKRGITYDEMIKQPTIQILNDNLIVAR
jgi:hypothetical protein